MLLAANAWSGWGSALVGTVPVVVGVLLGQLLINKSATRTERRRAANELIGQIMNLRDLATSQGHGFRGDYPLWPLRQQLATAAPDLGNLPAFEEAQAFYAAARLLRGWVRDHRRDGRFGDSEYHALVNYQEALRRYSDEVVAMLQTLKKRDAEPQHGRDRLPLLPE